jgi:hypothetical protein
MTLCLDPQHVQWLEATTNAGSIDRTLVMPPFLRITSLPQPAAANPKDFGTLIYQAGWLRLRLIGASLCLASRLLWLYELCCRWSFIV